MSASDIFNEMPILFEEMPGEYNFAEANKLLNEILLFLEKRRAIIITSGPIWGILIRNADKIRALI